MRMRMRMRALKLLIAHAIAICLVAIQPCSGSGSGATVVESWLHVRWQLLRPDCYERPVLTVNGAYPGPTLRARVGDTMRVHVCNHMHESAISIHFHGLHQRASPFMDGVSHVTQCAVQPALCQRVEFNVTQAGSYWWHAHHAALAADGAQGAIIIADRSEAAVAAGAAMDTDASGSMATGAAALSTLPPSDAFTSFLGQPLATASNSSAGRSQLLLMLTDWFHDPSTGQLAGVDGRDAAFRWVGEPNSLLLNGKGTYCADPKVGSNPWRFRSSDCAGAPASLYNSDAQCGYPILNVSCSSGSDANPLLLHVIGASSLSYMELRIDGHTMHIIGADGLAARYGEVNATSGLSEAMSSLEINSGERYDVLLRRTNATACVPFYRISVRSMYRVNQPQLFGILRYADSPSGDSGGMPTATSFPMPPTPSELAFPTGQPMPQPSAAPLSRLVTVDDAAQGDSDGDPSWSSLVSGEPAQRLLLVTRQERVDGLMRWTVNGVANHMPSTPSYFLSLLNYTGTGTRRNGSVSAAPAPAPDLQSDGSRMIDVSLGSVVEIVLQNSVALNGVCEQHPWHLHGMHALLLASGPGSFRPGVDNQTFPEMLRRARTDAARGRSTSLLKDTFTVFPMLDAAAAASQPPTLPFLGVPGSGCGWQALRIVADNAGIWLLHCHIAVHASMGMGVVLHVREEEGEDEPGRPKAFKPLPPLPRDAHLCGDPAVLFREEGNMRALLPHVFDTATAATAAAAVCPPSTTFVSPSSPLSSSNPGLIALLVVLVALIVGLLAALLLLYRRFEALKTSTSSANGDTRARAYVGAVAGSPPAAAAPSPRAHAPVPEADDDAASSGHNHAPSAYDADPQEHLVVQMMDTRSSRANSRAIEMEQLR